MFQFTDRMATNEEIFAANVRQNQLLAASHLMDPFCSSPPGGNATPTNQPTPTPVLSSTTPQSSSAVRPFDAAKECLTPRLREDGGLNAVRLPDSKYFRETVEVFTKQQFAAPLSEVVSAKVMRKAEKATDWLRGLIQDVSGRTLSFIEPFAVRGLDSMGSQQYPLVQIGEDLATEIAKAPSATKWRESLRIKQPGSQAPPFDVEATREAKELILLSTVIHEYVHGSRGVQIGRKSLYATRIGLQVNAFNGRSCTQRFDSLIEAAAVLTEARFLTDQGLSPERGWRTKYFDKTKDKTPSILAWNKMKALEAKKLADAAAQPPFTMRDRCVDLFKEVGVVVKHHQVQGNEFVLEMIRFGTPEARLGVGYDHLHWGMEQLATEVFRGRSQSAQHSVILFQEMLLKAEVLAEPRPVFREIINLAKKDVKASSSPAPLNERLLGKRYLEFFAHFHPNDGFDLMIFQAFVKAEHRLPQGRVASYRSELLDVYRCATTA